MDTIENYEEVENQEEDEFDMRDLDWLLDIDINDIDMDNYGKITSTFADDNIGNNTDGDGDDVSNDLNDIAQSDYNHNLIDRSSIVTEVFGKFKRIMPIFDEPVCLKLLRVISILHYYFFSIIFIFF